MQQETRRSPSPSQVGFTMDRRSVVKGGVALGAAGTFGGLLAACGSDSTGIGDASGSVRVGSNYSDEKTNGALKAALDALPNEDLTIDLNEVDHNTWQENINTYMQDPADDVIPWFAALRMGALARQDFLLDISDVWTNTLDDQLSGGFKSAVTWEGAQYGVPWTYYSWQVHYRKSVWEDAGASPPETWEEMLALCADLQGKGITPIAFGNGGNWPAMGTFDQINFRLNGYQYHVDLMAGRESWTDDRTKAVFTEWARLLPFVQEDANGREWNDAGTALANGEAAMMIIGNFVSDMFANEDLDDLDFFEFPVLNDEHGKDTVEAPIDTWHVVANPVNEEGAKEVVTYFGTAEAQETYLTNAPGLQAPNGDVDSATVHNALAQKSAEIVQNAKNLTQFLDRDAEPAFATEAGQAFADFYADPSRVDDILDDLQGKAEALT